jgi:alpha-ketoglutarate-dependent taurine dioxygenase
MSTVRIERIKPDIGGIVHVTKEHLLDPQTITAVRESLEDRGVLVFPRMNLTDAEQLDFTDKLGTRLNYNRKAPGSGAADEAVGCTARPSWARSGSPEGLTACIKYSGRR